MGVQVRKSSPGKIFIKMSHAEDFQEVTMGTRTRRTQNQPNVEELLPPTAAYGHRKKSPKLSASKYADLMKLTSDKSDLPVIRNQDHLLFYRNLPHSES